MMIYNCIHLTHLMKIQVATSQITILLRHTITCLPTINFQWNIPFNSFRHLSNTMNNLKSRLHILGCKPSAIQFDRSKITFGNTYLNLFVRTFIINLYNILLSKIRRRSLIVWGLSYFGINVIIVILCSFGKIFFSFLTIPHMQNIYIYIYYSLNILRTTKRNPCLNWFRRLIKMHLENRFSKFCRFNTLSLLWLSLSKILPCKSRSKCSYSTSPCKHLTKIIRTIESNLPLAGSQSPL